MSGLSELLCYKFQIRQSTDETAIVVSKQVSKAVNQHSEIHCLTWQSIAPDIYKSTLAVSKQVSKKYFSYFTQRALSYLLEKEMICKMV